MRFRHATTRAALAAAVFVLGCGDRRDGSVALDGAFGRDTSAARDGAGLRDGPAGVEGACPGYEPPPTVDGPLCRTQADCEGTAWTTFCSPSGMQTGCGSPCQEDRACETDGDCPGTQICVSYVGACCVEPSSTRCQPPCSESMSCGPGTRCAADGRECEPLPCTDGWECPASAACAPGTPGADGHGCVRRDCTTDADCDCGACVLRKCHDGPGACVGAAA